MPEKDKKTNPFSELSQKKFKKVEIKIDLKKILTWVLAIFLIFWLLGALANFAISPEEISFSQALSDIKNEKVEKIEISGNQIDLYYQDQSFTTTRKESGDSLVSLLQQEGIDPSELEIKVKDESLSQIWIDILLTIIPLVLIGAFFYFTFKQARGAQDSIFSFGKSKARQFFKGKQDATFADVAGVDEAKNELEEVVDFLKHPAKYRRLGARTPKGVLLVGPPGTGKTLLARAVAGEANVPFYSMAGSEFMEMLVGVGSARMRDLFETAKKNAPAIIFIDEIESIGRSRSRTVSSGHDEREQTLNQMLVEMDGFSPNDNVIVIGASNRPDLLDSALLRPGRFDRRVVLDMPDIQGRGAILKIHAQGKPFDKSVDWEKAAKQTVGFSGADLENMLNEAAILAARANKKAIEMEDLEEAATKVKLGPQKKRLQSEQERKIAAYHESGHALIAHLLPNVDPIGRVSIVARGLTLGHTMISPIQDRTQETKTRLMERLSVLLGGRAAEELVFSEMTTGASDDIKKANRLARSMVVDFGMSSLGPVTWDGQDGEEEWLVVDSVSAKMKARIDGEIEAIIKKAYRQAKTILKENKKILIRLAKELLVKETLDQAEFERVVGKKRKSNE
ncbi:MAG: ATP-dependent zinc metalloprotease FtsH [Candidatus Shapirobacteria bacterium]|nr:ATP-dependent zinc metalloprotease FtsH [Candidatus Shapirobacteria bacterium]MDD5073640.1 ATP-dependent zinc metalloprotease FtsH [Candidatus Shapirobacteria bacterium]MDD5481399.1 ATP-dependent zinc metalloprotease FtsH [Candidatus Shapirobacteria bacterium]